MAPKQIMEGAYLLALGPANCVLLDEGADLVLVDAGFPGKVAVVVDAIRALGRKPGDLRHLVFTHSHPDHIGSAAAIVQATGAATWMHTLDAPLAETGGPFRPMTRSPGLWPRIAFPLFWHPNEPMQPFRIDHRFEEGDRLPVAGGLETIHTPGHSAGQVAFKWKGERLLIAGDVGINLFGLADPIGFEDIEEGRRSQRKIAALRFDAVAFGHGKPILSHASDLIRKKWG